MQLNGFVPLEMGDGITQFDRANGQLAVNVVLGTETNGAGSQFHRGVGCCVPFLRGAEVRYVGKRLIHRACHIDFFMEVDHYFSGDV